MKNIIIYLLILVPAYIFSKEVPTFQASNVAINWMNEKFGENLTIEDIQEIITEKNGDISVYHIIILKFSYGIWLERWVPLDHLFKREQNISEIIFQYRTNNA